MSETLQDAASCSPLKVHGQMLQADSTSFRLRRPDERVLLHLHAMYNQKSSKVILLYNTRTALQVRKFSPTFQSDLAAVAQSCRSINVTVPIGEA